MPSRGRENLATEALVSVSSLTKQSFVGAVIVVLDGQFTLMNGASLFSFTGDRAKLYESLDAS